MINFNIFLTLSFPAQLVEIKIYGKTHSFDWFNKEVFFLQLLIDFMINEVKLFKTVCHIKKTEWFKNLRFKPTSDERGWLIPLFDDNSPWYVYILTSIPALLLTILLFMDQQITSVIVNRKEHKLKVHYCIHTQYST